MHEAFAGTAFWVTVLEVPAGGFEGGALEGGLPISIVDVGVSGAGAGVGITAAVFGEVVFLVADHGSRKYLMVA